MKSRVFRAALLLLASLFPAGCGTVSNLCPSRPDGGGMVAFGGVKRDLRQVNQGLNGELGTTAHPKPEAEPYPQRALMLVCAIDLPFSLVGDVVTWPYTVAYNFINAPIPTPPVMLAPAELPPAVPPPAVAPLSPVPSPRKLP